MVVRLWSVTMTEVVFAGDWHGNALWAVSRIQSIGSSGPVTILHVGDFGIWPGPSGKRYLQTVENVCARHDVDILITPGNHEDWARLTALWDNPKNLDPKFGGAASVDKHYRVEGVSWWPEEMPSEADVAYAVAGGPVDVLITHDSPEPQWCIPAVRDTLILNPHGWPQDSLTWAGLARARVNHVFESVQPRLLVHGHHHVWGERVVQLPGAAHTTSLDVIQRVERIPGPDEKVVADDVCVAAGGPAANAAVAFARLGGRAVLVTRIGDDSAGSLVRSDLATNGVEVIEPDRPDGLCTTVASILVTRDTGDRAVVSTTDRGRSAAAARAELDPAEIFAGVSPAAVLIDSHERDLSEPLAAFARRRSIPVILDCGAKKSHTDRQLGDVDVAVVSEHYLVGGPAAIGADITAHGVGYGAVTAGPGPITFWTPGSDLSRLVVREIVAVDTLGAGDFFHGALTHWIACHGLAPGAFADGLSLAGRVAALSVQEFGSRSWLRRLSEVTAP